MRRVMQTIYLDYEQAVRLDKVAEENRLPKAVIVREGLDLILAKYDSNGKPKKKKK